MSKNSDRWWKMITRRSSKVGDDRLKTETRRVVRKALEASGKKTLPDSEVERVPADMRQKTPRHVQHADGGHVHFYREHLLFGRSVVKKDPITRKFKRAKLGDRRDEFYDPRGGLYGDLS